jgi:hypothetical protein
MGDFLPGNADDQGQEVPVEVDVSLIAPEQFEDRVVDGVEEFPGPGWCVLSHPLLLPLYMATLCPACHRGICPAHQFAGEKASISGKIPQTP